MMNKASKFRDTNVKLDFKDVLIVPKRSSIVSRKNVDIERSIRFKKVQAKWKGVPIVASNMDTVTGLESFDVLRQYNYISCFPKHLNNEWVEMDKLPAELQYTNHYMISCGINEWDYTTATKLIDRLEKECIFVKFLCVDVANGYMSKLTDVCSSLRERYPNIILTAGNVVTPEGAYDLIKSGVDIVKSGIGSGSACTTRLKTGVGYPQLSTILECRDICHTNGAYLMSDGGIVHPGDVVKAFSAGADFVMLGSMLAAHNESPGELHLNPRDNQWYKSFYGMSSRDAMNKHHGGVKNYRTAEGKTVMLKCKGKLSNTLEDINGGIRSACTYTNCSSITELYENTEFVLVTKTHNSSLE
jgi:GMP reductase